MKWRFVSPGEETPFRDEPMDSLMEARPDAWLLEWTDEDRIHEAMCLPMLNAFAQQCADLVMHSNDTLHAEWAQHWADASRYGNVMVGAKNVALYAAACMGDTGQAQVAHLLHEFCDRARGSLR